MPDNIKNLPLTHQLEIITNYLTDAIQTADGQNKQDIADALDSLQEDLIELQENL